jgi:hypothetical protein
MWINTDELNKIVEPLKAPIQSVTPHSWGELIVPILLLGLVAILLNARATRVPVGFLLMTYIESILKSPVVIIVITAVLFFGTAIIIELPGLIQVFKEIKSKLNK